MAIKIAVIDDMHSEREILKEYLNRMQEEQKQSFAVDFYTNAEEVLSVKKRYDIMIFDIDMPGMNGMEAAKSIRAHDKRVVIMFVTNVAQYAINGYEVDAVDYVLKPISYYDFVMKMKRALYRVSQKSDVSILIETLDGTLSLYVSDIIYVEVMLHYVIYHTEREEYRSRSSMKEVEKELYVYNFRKCHKSMLVNLAHVKTLKSAEVELSTGINLPLSRTQKTEFMQDYISYVKG
ncbi:MAG: response regulator transcription factor [Clostridia bacterium]|nr:response regulator transcription factor [Clostridia bacterium]